MAFPMKTPLPPAIALLLSGASLFVADPGTTRDGDFEVGPDYADTPETKRGEDVPHGELKEFTMSSADSKISK